MKFNSDNTFLINLDRRPDRLSEATAQLKRVGIDFTRYSAVEGRNIDCKSQCLSKVEIAVLLSNINLWKMAIEKNIPEIAIFEDDIVFSEDFNERFPLFLENLPLDWEIIHLGPKTLKSLLFPLNQYVAVLGGTYYGTHAYIIRRKVIDLLVSNSNNLYRTLEIYMSEILINNNIHHFCPLTQLCWQSNSISDINPNRVQEQVGPGFLCNI